MADPKPLSAEKNANRRLRQIRAHRAIRNEVRTGRMIVPDRCELCGTPDRKCKNGRRYLEGHHHKGYEFPLEVQWVCPSCHTKQEDCRRRKGTRHGNHKLTDDVVRVIRVSGLSVRELSKLLGIANSRVASARRGDTWKHLDDPASEYHSFYDTRQHVVVPVAELRRIVAEMRSSPSSSQRRLRAFASDIAALIEPKEKGK